MKMTNSERTPSEVLFNTLKRRCGLSHKDLAELILSNKPLADGRSALEHAKDRTWLSHVIVHAPVGAQQERYFADYGMSAVRVLARLRTARAGMGAQDVISLLTGEPLDAMASALAYGRQDPNIYRNAMMRLVGQHDRAQEEVAESCLVLFIAAGCSGNSYRAVSYLETWLRDDRDAILVTPRSTDLGHDGPAPAPTTLGLVRIEGGRIAGAIHWVPSQGLTIGALVMGGADVTDVAPDVSGEHARVWRDALGRWLVEDLGSSNGTTVVEGSSGDRVSLVAHEPHQVHAGDVLVVGKATSFALLEGCPHTRH